MFILSQIHLTRLVQKAHKVLILQFLMKDEEVHQLRNVVLQVVPHLRVRREVGVEAALHQHLKDLLTLLHVRGVETDQYACRTEDLFYLL